MSLPSRSPLPAPELQSFFLGGFECATHRRRDRTRIDVIAGTGHDGRCAGDYKTLAEAGVRTVRDGLRWHLIEQTAGVYDWSSFTPMLDAALRTGTQVIWDLCHWGVPDGLSPFSPEFAPRFAQFAAAAAQLIRQRANAAGQRGPTLLCPINEISFWSWVGGDEEHFFPYGKGNGPALKRCLAGASLAAIRAVRAVDPQVRFVQAEPIIHISADPRKPEDKPFADHYTSSQFEVWDELAGRSEQELGGAEDMLDVLGVNYYWNNQWIHKGDRTPPGHPLHTPLHQMLLELWHRYKRPLIVTETGAEKGAAAGWLGYICAEVRQAIRAGVPVLGICLYPVMDYPGWDDGRHCSCGLIACSPDWEQRSFHTEVLEELRVQQRAFGEALPVADEALHPVHSALCTEDLPVA